MKWLRGGVYLAALPLSWFIGVLVYFVGFLHWYIGVLVYWCIGVLMGDG